MELEEGLRESSILKIKLSRELTEPQATVYGTSEWIRNSRTEDTRCFSAYVYAPLTGRYVYGGMKLQF